MNIILGYMYKIQIRSQAYFFLLPKFLEQDFRLTFIRQDLTTGIVRLYY